MLSIKLVVLDTKQGGNMTYLHVYNQVGCPGHETGWQHDLSSCLFIYLFIFINIFRIPQRPRPVEGVSLCRRGASNKR